MRVTVPPIKSQGIKTRLAPWIRSIVPNDIGRWIEPFMGTGVVAFNLAPKRALLCDTNPHLIAFYQGIAAGEITPGIVRHYLETEGARLSEKGESHYYAIRNRFNEKHRPLDFLFLNRAGFNGMIRFNQRGGFNVPFYRKPTRFAQAYITKITNQVSHVDRLIRAKDFVFRRQPFEQTIAQAGARDIIYCDPPYIDRHADYYNGWDGEQEEALFRALSNTSARFILSTWHHNDFRENKYIKSLWGRFNLLTRAHFYHVGASENNRNPMIEAIISNYATASHECREKQQEQLMLLEKEAAYSA